MLDAAPSRLAVQAAPPPPVARLVIGRPVAEVCALIPRIFSLCRAAQSAAVCRALDHDGPAVDGLRAEMLRDHLLILCHGLPTAMGKDPLPLPPNWQDGGLALARAVFGPAGAPPTTTDDLAAWLASDKGVAPTLAALSRRFPKGEAVAKDLPLATGSRALRPGACENSVAARRAGHPAMRLVEDRYGRGPLWRALARACDIAALVFGSAPHVTTHGPGRVTVPAARGTYALRATATDGRVTRFDRITPTDHLLAPGGILERSLATLPAGRARLGPLVLAVLDPCRPVDLKGLSHA